MFPTKIFKFFFIIVLIPYIIFIFTDYAKAKAPDKSAIEKTSGYFNSEGGLHPVVLQLSWLHQFQFAGYYAAVEKGFYRDAGFQVTIIEGRSGINPVEKVVSGKANYATGRVSILLHRLHGEPVVVLAAIFQHSAHILLAKKESGIHSPHDMIGRRVMMLEGDDSAEFMAMFRKEGISLKQINIIPSSFDIDDLIKDKTDVFNAYSTNEPYYLINQGIPISIINPKSYGINFYGDCLFTSEQEQKERPDQVKAFREASLRGWQYAMDHPEEIIDLILATYEVKKTRSHLIVEARAIRELMFPDLVQIGHMNPGRWHHIADTYIDLGMADPDFSLEGFIYDPDPEPDLTWIRWFVGAIVSFSLLVGLSSIVLLIFNKKLKIEVWQRKKAQKKLIENERKIRQYLDVAGVIILALDTDGNITLINEHGLKILGYQQKELLGKNWFNTCLPDRFSRDILDVYHQLLKGKIKLAANYVNPIRKKDGREQIISWHNAFIRNPSGEITGTLSSGEDITERKELEDELQLKNLVFEKAITGNSTADNKGIITHVNKAFIRFWGYEKKKEVIGKHVGEVLKFKEETKKIITALNKNGEWEGEYTALKKDKTTFAAYGLGTIIKDESGNLIGYQSTALDISKQKQAENSLRESEIKYRSMMNAMKDYVYICSLDYRIEYMNPAMIRELGHDAIGENCFKAIHGLDEICTWCMHKKIFNKECFEYNIVSPRNKHHYQITNSPIIHDDGSVSKMTVYKDITDLVKMEEQFIQAQKMESVGRLAGGVAHDFNNLLTIVLGNTGLMAMDNSMNNRNREILKEIETAGQRAADLIRQLLAFSRKQVIQPQILRLNILLKNTEKMLTRLISENIELKMIQDPELWKIKMDPGQVDQVIINLAVNARDAMPNGGSITFETANVDLDINWFNKRGIKPKPGQYVKLTVSDTGHGMDNKTLKKIFEPFFSTKEIGKGTGLGLSTVYGIIKQNRGLIWAKSKPGQGTAFKIYLPKESGKEKTKENKKNGKPGLIGSETIFIVEDDDKLREFIQKILDNFGYSTVIAENGEQALRVVKENDLPILLMITDVMMPKMNGKELSDKIQILYPDIKVIFMSGYTDDVIASQGVLETGLNFLEKPFTPEGLNRKIREVLDNGH